MTSVAGVAMVLERDQELDGAREQIKNGLRSQAIAFLAQRDDTRRALDEMSQFLAGLDERRWSKPEQEQRRVLIGKANKLLRPQGADADHHGAIDAKQKRAAKLAILIDKGAAVVPDAQKEAAGRMREAFALMNDGTYASYPKQPLTMELIRNATKKFRDKTLLQYATAFDLERCGVTHMTREQMEREFGVAFAGGLHDEVTVLPIAAPKKDNDE